MPNFEHAISWASHSGDVEFELSATDWEGLESAYERVISHEQREEFLNICQVYLNARHSELNAAKPSEIREIAEKIYGSIKPFINFAQTGSISGGSVDRTDARMLFTNLLERELSQRPLNITCENPCARTEDGGDNMPSLEMEATLTTFLLGMVAKRLQSSFDAILGQQALSALSQNGFRNGDAISNFLAAAKEWATKHRLPKASHSSKARKCDNAGELAHFLKLALGQFPTPYNYKLNATAIADRLKKVTTALNRRNRGS
nr:hypothetical protein [uncultured Gellertiella sp.]